MDLDETFWPLLYSIEIKNYNEKRSKFFNLRPFSFSWRLLASLGVSWRVLEYPFKLRAEGEHFYQGQNQNIFEIINYIF